MLIQKGNVEILSSLPWAAVDIASERRLEEIVLHISRWAHSSVTGPFQLFFPVKSRDIPGVDMLSPYLLARVENLKFLNSLQTIYGVYGIMRNHENKIIEVEDSFVQQMISMARLEAMSWSHGIEKGSFVRILFGNERMLCGTVRRTKDGIASVEVSLRMRKVRIRVPERALLNLDFVPKENRNYFYVPQL